MEGMVTGNSGAVLIIVIAVVAIGLLVFSGPIIAAFGNLSQMIQDWINQIRGSLPGAGGDVNGVVGLAFRLTFADGSTRDINQDLSYSVLPLTISFENKTLSQIQIMCNGKMQTTVGHWSTSTDLLIEVYKKPNTTPEISSTGTYPMTGSTWAANAVKTIAETTFQASTLKNVVAQHGGEGNYLLQVVADVDLTVTASDGVQVTLHATSFAAGIDFTYEDGVPTSLSVTSLPKSLVP
jgi:hypothetical protein